MTTNRHKRLPSGRREVVGHTSPAMFLRARCKMFEVATQAVRSERWCNRQVLSSIRLHSRHRSSSLLRSQQAFPSPARDASGPHGNNGRTRSSAVSDAVY